MPLPDGSYGTPYSLDEAKGVVADMKHPRLLYSYHLELMEFLISEVERLNMELTGAAKARELLLKGMESQAELMHELKQKARAGD